jgi:ATP-dependent DNA helicase RecG
MISLKANNFNFGLLKYMPDETLRDKNLATRIKEGESETLEFKRSTGELKEAMQTLCAFLNGKGGTVLFGIRPDGNPEGQEVT